MSGPIKYRHRVLGLLGAFAVLVYVDRICISIAGKSIQDELGLNPAQWGWVLGSFIVAYALFEIPSGLMGDRIGPRSVLMRIVTWWSVFTAVTGMVTGFYQMLIARFLFGAGEAGAYPNASAVIARWFPKSERGRAQGFMFMASKIGGAISPLMVIPIQQAYGWRASFYVFGLAGLIWAAVWYWWFRDNPRDKRGVSAAEIADIGSHDVSSRHGGFAWREAARSSNFWWILLGYHAHCWPAFFFLTWLFPFLENGRGFSKAELLQLSWVPFVFGAAANAVGGVASDFLIKRRGLKFGRRAVGVLGHLFSAIFILAAIATDDRLLTVAFLALAYAGSDFALPAAWAVCLDIAGKNAGAVTGAMNTAGQVGSFLGTILFGYIVHHFGSYNLALLPVAAMGLLASVVWFKIDATRPLFASAPVDTTSQSVVLPPTIGR